MHTSFLLRQDSLPVLGIIIFMVGLCTNDLLVIVQRLIGEIHVVWCLPNNE